MDFAYLSQYENFLNKFAPLNNMVSNIDIQHGSQEKAIPEQKSNIQKSFASNKAFQEGLVWLIDRENILLSREKAINDQILTSTTENSFQNPQNTETDQKVDCQDMVLAEIDKINSSIYLIKNLKEIEAQMKSNESVNANGVSSQSEKDITLMKSSLQKNLEELKVTSIKKTTEQLRKSLKSILENDRTKLAKLVKSVKNLKEFTNLFVSHYEIVERNRISKVILDLNLILNNEDQKSFLQFSLETILRFQKFDLYILKECFMDGEITQVYTILRKIYNEPQKELKGILTKRLKSYELNYSQLLGMYLYSENFVIQLNKEVMQFIDEYNVYKEQKSDGNSELSSKNFPIILQIKEILDEQKKKFDKSFQEIESKFSKFDIRNMGSSNWRNLDDYMTSIAYFFSIEIELTNPLALTIPQRPIQNFLQQLSDRYLDFMNSLQIIKIEKQLEAILRRFKVGKLAPKIFDIVIQLNERHLELAKKLQIKALSDEISVFEPSYAKRATAEKISLELYDFKSNFMRKKINILNQMEVLEKFEVKERVYNWFKSECNKVLAEYLKNPNESIQKNAKEILELIN